MALSRQSSGDIRLPISKPVLHALVGSLNPNNSSAFHRTLFSTMFLIAFYGFFRIGELAAKNANSGGSVVQFSDMRFLTHDGNIHMLKITITNFKHNTDQRPFVILIERAAGERPVLLSFTLGPTPYTLIDLIWFAPHVSSQVNEEGQILDCFFVDW